MMRLATDAFRLEVMTDEPRWETEAARLDEAFEATPRTAFLPEAVRARWAEDRPLPLAAGMTNSQPSTVRDMLRLLGVRRGARVLDVGSGSGWTTALLAHLVGSDGEVIGVEIEPELVTFGRDRLDRMRRPWARIEAAAPGVLGRPELGPYDRILVSAMARRLPDELVEQLAADGVLLAPVAGRMVRARRAPAGDVTLEQFGAYRFVPLR